MLCCAVCCCAALCAVVLRCCAVLPCCAVLCCCLLLCCCAVLLCCALVLLCCSVLCRTFLPLCCAIVLLCCACLTKLDMIQAEQASPNISIKNVKRCYIFHRKANWLCQSHFVIKSNAIFNLDLEAKNQGLAKNRLD